MSSLARRAGWTLLALFIALLLYLSFWPVPIEPLVWSPPRDPGYTGVHARNERLADIERLPIGDQHGPEDIALDAQGRIYAATGEGNIVRLEADGTRPRVWARTHGRPLGIDFDAQGNLIVADAYRGLLSIAPSGEVAVLATKADGAPIRYADDVDCALDGRIYFSDASARFGAKRWGGTFEASLLDLMEHGKTGRLLVYDPRTKRATTVLSGLSFANGVAVSPDQRFVLVNETGEYRVVRLWLHGPKAGQHDVFAGALPGFPDNITSAENRFWVALVSPRSADLDRVAGSPFLRKLIQRLPAFLRPAAKSYGHVVALDLNGKVVQDLQDPAGGYPINTAAVETREHLYLGSLVTDHIGRIAKASTGLHP